MWGTAMGEGGTAGLEGAGVDWQGLRFTLQPLHEAKIRVKAAVNPGFNPL